LWHHGEQSLSKRIAPGNSPELKLQLLFAKFLPHVALQHLL
jgi:hypothetical protein